VRVGRSLVGAVREPPIGPRTIPALPRRRFGVPFGHGRFGNRPYQATQAATPAPLHGVRRLNLGKSQYVPD
jgi:hypothetical protein